MFGRSAPVTSRVGRGAEQSYCLLVSRAKEELTESARERLEAMVASTDGFELAERDLEIRGGGQLLGARQSGLSDAREVARSLRVETMAAEVEALPVRPHDQRLHEAVARQSGAVRPVPADGGSSVDGETGKRRFRS